MMLMRQPLLTVTFATVLTGTASGKELFTMSKVIGSDPGAPGTCVAVMEGGELARKLERVFQIFCRAQEDWAVEHDPGRSTGDLEPDGDCSA